MLKTKSLQATPSEESTRSHSELISKVSSASLLRRSISLPSEAGTENYLEDQALTQSMFENGTLICHGEAEAFVNIIRTSRNSIKNMDSNDVK